MGGLKLTSTRVEAIRQLARRYTLQIIHLMNEIDPFAQAVSVRFTRGRRAGAQMRRFGPLQRREDDKLVA